MWPWMRSGDIVHISPAERVSVGDVVLYERGQRWFIHRLIRLESNTDGQQRLILRGDALRVDDAPVAPEQVLGCVSKIERGSRLIPVDSPLNRACITLSRMPVLGYVVLPLGYRYLSRLKRVWMRWGKHRSLSV